MQVPQVGTACQGCLERLEVFDVVVEYQGTVVQLELAVVATVRLPAVPIGEHNHLVETESSGMAGAVLVERKSDLVQDILAAASKRVSDAHLGAKSSVLSAWLRRVVHLSFHNEVVATDVLEKALGWAANADRTSLGCRWAARFVVILSHCFVILRFMIGSRAPAVRTIPGGGSVT